MKLKDQFVVRQIAGTWVAVPIGERTAEVNGLLSLSETGVFLWEKLQQDVTFEDLLTAIVGEFDVAAETAEKDICAFIESLDEKDLIIK